MSFGESALYILAVILPRAPIASSFSTGFFFCSIMKSVKGLMLKRRHVARSIFFSFCFIGCCCHASESHRDIGRLVVVGEGRGVAVAAPLSLLFLRARKREAVRRPKVNGGESENNSTTSRSRMYLPVYRGRV